MELGRKTESSYFTIFRDIMIVTPMTSVGSWGAGGDVLAFFHSKSSFVLLAQIHYILVAGSVVPKMPTKMCDFLCVMYRRCM